MSVDLRPRRGSRAYVRTLADFKPAKLRGCFGGITPGPGFIIGGSIGQVPEAQIPSTNILRDTESPSVGWGGTAGFGNNGALAQWDAGFFGTAINAPTGVENMQSAVTAAQANTQYTLSGQFSITPALLAAIGLFATPGSLSVTYGVIWAGGAGRTDSITFNPATGVISAVSAGLSNVTVKTFSATLANGTQILVTQVSFTTAATPAGTNQAIVNINPSVGAAGQVAGGAFQLEVGTIATSFIPTSTFVSASRALGKSPRQQVDLGANPIIISGASTRQGSFDTGQIYIVTTNGATFSFGGIADNNGDWFDVFFTGSTFCTLNSAIAIVGAGLPAAGVTSLTLPYNGSVPAGGSGPWNVCGARFTFSTALNQWIMSAIAESHGKLFVGNFTFTPGDGVTTVWLDASAGGGGGGGCAANAANGSAAGGGGAGGALKDAVFVVAPGTSVSITSGAAGTGGAAGANNGVAGGNTIIGALVTLTGGGLGAGAATGATGAGGAAGAGGAFISLPGDNGQLIAGTLALGGQGGANMWGQVLANLIVAAANSAAGKLGAGSGSGGGGGGSGATGAAAAGGNGVGGFVTITW